jgi:NAD dependent epimerase/dehydratase family enzyme
VTVLVTGATGSLGRSVVARLLAEGRRVAILTRRPFAADALFGPDMAIHEWHPDGEPVPPAALRDVTGIVHLAGEPLAGWPVLDRRDLVATSRKTTTRRLVEALASQAGPNRLVIASVALGLAGEGDAVSEAEVAEAGGTEAATQLSDTVHTWEEVALGSQASELSVAIVRLALVAGSGAPLSTLVALACRGVVADLRGSRIAAIDTADAAAMLSGLVQHPALTGRIHGAAPMVVKGDALTSALAALSPMPWLPYVPLALLGRTLGHAMPLLASRRPVRPARLLEAGADFSVPDPWPSLDAAIRAIAATPTRDPSLWASLRGGRKPTPPAPAKGD